AAARPLLTKVTFLGTTPAAYTHADVTRVLRDSAQFAVDPATVGRKGRLGVAWWMPQAFRNLGDNMLGRDGESHRRLRRLVDHAFTRREIASMQTRVAEIADELIAPHRASGKPFDLVSHIARPLPLRVIVDLLGLDPKRIPEFSRLAPKVVNLEKPWHFARMIPGVLAMNKLLLSEVRAARRDERPGLISELVRAEADGDTLTEDELVTMLFLLLFAGHETTVHLISTSVRALRRDVPEPAFPTGEIGEVSPEQLNAVTELMRYCAPVEMTEPRYAVSDVEVAGHAMKRGEPIVALLAAANRDPTTYDTPDVLDLARDPNPQTGFGGGPHTCLGAQLARIEAAIVLNAMFNDGPAIELVDPDAFPQWQFSPGFHGHRRLMVRFAG
ncbi:MAG: cytochrome P450, partial [Pseudomonadota bacterium]